VKAATLPRNEFERSILGQLSTLDRFLPVWIGVAMAIGLALGRAFPGLNDQLDRVKIGTTSLPIAIGLLGMMYPVLAKVRYDRLRSVTADRPLLLSSLLLTWVVGPALMFTLAWIFLPDLPAFRTGIILVGLAPCIAMVLIWNALALGDGEAAAVLVVLNAILEVAIYALLGYFYLRTLPGWLGLNRTAVDFALWDIAKSVLIFLGVPLVLGFLTSLVGRKRKGDDWYEQRFLPRIGPFALYSLLFTIVILFAIQGHAITSAPLDVARIAVPLLAYFAIMWTAAFAWGRAQGLAYPKTATLAFTAAGNNFELAIAVAIGTFGVNSGQALAAVVGPLIEVPALVTLVYVSLWAGRRYFGDSGLTAPENELRMATSPSELAERQ
jgi:ACR3 family arsenite transporter